MIVYYTANEEKPSSLIGVKFFLNQETAQQAASEDRLKCFSFEVNDKLKTSNFGMDTILVFRKDLQTGALKFMASGGWLEVHKLLNVPFYYDFETRSKVYVSMTLKYFNAHYSIVENEVEKPVDDEDEDFPEIIPEVVEIPKKKQTKKEKPVLVENPVDTVETDEIDEDVVDELFGPFEQSNKKSVDNSDLTKMLF